MQKKGWHKAFWNNFRFKYKLTIINENTLEEVVGLHVSKLNGLSVLLTALAFLFLIAALIITLTPLRNYLPGYMNSEVRSQIVANALKTDSLQQLVEKQNLYIVNIQDIFRGKIKAETVKSMDSLTAMRKDSLMGHTEREMNFRKKYEETEKYNLTNTTSRIGANGPIFYRPLRGLISKPFNAANGRFGIDIAANPGESILAVLDGTIILQTFTAENGYIIEVQHSQEFISVYKHCGSLLKHEGETVKGGEPIALIGESSKSGKSSFLHFELWHKGKAVNPEQYILFK
jgi:lipoprotein NlpD